MSSLVNLNIRAKIRSRINIIEKNVCRHIHPEILSKTRDRVHQLLNIKDEDLETGILKPKVFSKTILNKITKPE